MRIEPAQLFKPLQVSQREIDRAHTELKNSPMRSFSLEVRRLNGQSLDLKDLARENAENQRREQGWHFKHQGWVMGSFSTWPHLDQKKNEPGQSDVWRLSLALQKVSSFLVSADGLCHGFTHEETLAIFQGVSPDGPDLPDRLVDKALARVKARGADERFLPLQMPANNFFSMASELIQETPGRFHLAKQKKRRAPQKPDAQPESTRQAFEAALGSVRQEALDLQATTTAATNWLSQGDRFRRTQAMNVLPGVLTLLVENANTHADALAIGRLIDDGQPWFETLAAVLEKQYLQEGLTVPDGFQATVVRGLHRMSRMPQDAKPGAKDLSAFGQDLDFHEMMHQAMAGREVKQNKGSQRLGALLWMCGQIETVDFPQRKGQFSAMFNTAARLFLASQGETTDWKRFQNYRPILKGVLKAAPWGAKEWLVPSATLNQIAMAQRDAGQWVLDAFAGASTPHRKDAKDRLFETWTPKQWLDASEVLHRFHEQATIRESARQVERMKVLDQGLIEPMWTAGGPEDFEHKGVSFRPLRHPLELLREGKEMTHCVAGYAPQCLQGHSRIFALKDADTGERATLEVRQFALVDNGGFVFEQEQLFAPENEQPSLAIKAAARQFLETLNRDYTTQAWPEVPIPADLERYDNGPDEVFYEQTRAWMRSRHKGLYEALKQGPVVKPEPLVDNAVEITLAERRQQRQAPGEIWTVVPALPGMGP